MLIVPWFLRFFHVQFTDSAGRLRATTRTTVPMKTRNAISRSTQLPPMLLMAPTPMPVNGALMMKKEVEMLMLMLTLMLMLLLLLALLA